MTVSFAQLKRCSPLKVPALPAGLRLLSDQNPSVLRGKINES